MARPSLTPAPAVRQVARLPGRVYARKKGPIRSARPSGLVDSQAGAETEVVPFLEGGLSKPPGWLLIATSLRATTGPNPDRTKEE